MHYVERYATVIFLLITTVLWLTFEQWVIGLIPAALFIFFLLKEETNRRLLYLALSAGLAILVVAPINSDTSIAHVSFVLPFYVLSIILPRLVLWRHDKSILKIRFFPEKFRWSDFFFICITIPLSALGLYWYLTYANPEVTQNWDIVTETPVKSLFMLALGMYLAGFWDEAFGQNTALAIFERMFPPFVAITFSSAIYAAALWDLAFRGWGFFVMYMFAFSQGILWRRSRCLFWVIIVHFSLEVLLYYLIVSAKF